MICVKKDLVRNGKTMMIFGATVAIAAASIPNAVILVLAETIYGTDDADNIIGT
jgi:hypothetical protein